MKVVCTKIFDNPCTGENSLKTGEIYELDSKNGSPILVINGLAFQICLFQLEFFTPLSEIRNNKINEIFED